MDVVTDNFCLFTGWGDPPVICFLSLVCSTFLMASLIRSGGGLSKCFYQGLWLVDLNADVIGQSINRRGVDLGLPKNSLTT